MLVTERLLNSVETFDPLKLSYISSLTVSNKENEAGHWECHINIVSNYWPDLPLEITFYNVKRIKLPEFGETSILTFAELVIEDVRNFGMEGVNYSVVDHVNGFSCDCQNIRVDLHESY